MDMSWIETSLTRLERQLREIIERDSGVEGIPRKLHHQLEKELATAMRAGIQTMPMSSKGGNKREVPDEYTLVLPPLLAEQLLTHPQELDLLARHLAETAGRGGYGSSRAPILHVVADPAASQVRIVTSHNQDGTGNSRTAILEGAASNGDGGSNPGRPMGFLIVNGLTTYPLSRTVTNIGRDASNHIQVDDRRVSRLHAQVRLIHGRYVIFDLDSTGGTTVNDIAVGNVSQHVLNPGDVIRLAGVPLVYGQEQGVQAGYTQEVPANPSQPTVR